MELSFKVDYFIPVENSGRVQSGPLCTRHWNEKKSRNDARRTPPPLPSFCVQHRFLRNTVRPSLGAERSIDSIYFTRNHDSFFRNLTQRRSLPVCQVCASVDVGARRLSRVDIIASTTACCRAFAAPTCRRAFTTTWGDVSKRTANTGRRSAYAVLFFSVLAHTD